jgi:hypothetical protein
MICDSCRKNIHPDKEYYILKIEVKSKKVEDYYDTWFLCRDCFDEMCLHLMLKRKKKEDKK